MATALSAAEQSQWDEIESHAPAQTRKPNAEQIAALKAHGVKRAAFTQSLSSEKQQHVKSLLKQQSKQRKKAGASDATSKAGAKALKNSLKEDGKWAQCMFWIAHKQRYCGMARVAGTQHCGVHVNDGTLGASVRGKGERIPCPIDPTHSIYKNQLESHLKVCNRKRGREEMEAQLYFSKDINSGPAGSYSAEEAAALASGDLGAAAGGGGSNAAGGHKVAKAQAGARAAREAEEAGAGAGAGAGARAGEGGGSSSEAGRATDFTGRSGGAGAGGTKNAPGTGAHGAEVSHSSSCMHSSDPLTGAHGAEVSDPSSCMYSSDPLTGAREPGRRRARPR
jgi:hypothetical protein